MFSVAYNWATKSLPRQLLVNPSIPRFVNAHIITIHGIVKVMIEHNTDVVFRDWF